MNPTLNLLAQPQKEQDATLSPDPTSREYTLRATRALSSVINYIITDAFDLSAEESMWVSYHMKMILQPLEGVQPDALMGAVDNEMRCGEYSTRMFRRLTDESSNPSKQSTETLDASIKAKRGTIEDWVESVSDIVLTGYPNLRPMLHSRVVGGIHGLFLELGVTESLETSRPSLYLPTSVRFTLNQA